MFRQNQFNLGGATIISKIKGMFSRFNMTTVLYLLAFLLFIFITIYIYKSYVSPKLTPTYNNSQEGNHSGKQAELMLFYVDWCPHCKTGKPAWDEVKNEYQNRIINGYNVIFKEYNCTEETAEIEKLMNQYHIEGYPTIKLLKDGQVIEFDAKPTKAALEQFLNTVL